MAIFRLSIKLHAVSLILLLTLLMTGCGGRKEVAAPSPKYLASTSTVDYTEFVQALYISYFGRPADINGLANFRAQLAAISAPNSIQQLNAEYGKNAALKNLIDSFGDSPESLALYSGNNIDFITAIYDNVLGRKPDQDGLEWWVSALDKGKLTRANASLAIMAGALENASAAGKNDGQLIKNRLAVASYFTESLRLESVNFFSGDVAAARARSMLSTVDAGTDVVAFQAIVKAAINTLSSSTAVVPTVELSSNVPNVALGGAVDISWSAKNSTYCLASGAWSGPIASAGVVNKVAAMTGQSKYKITCTGLGGTTSKSILITVPIPVLPSSHENRLSAGNAIGPQPLPGGLPLLKKYTEFVTAGVAFADFFQDGSFSMVAFSNDFEVVMENQIVAQIPGQAYFLKRNSLGQWEDHTAELLKDQTGCISPRKVIVADFNGDGKPDVFASCTGVDLNPQVGEHPRFLMSQSDGKYKNVVAPIVCYCHSASAADVNGDGMADVLVTDLSDKRQEAYFLINNGDGTFSPRYNTVPDETKWWDLGPPTWETTTDWRKSTGTRSVYAPPIYTVELIDLNGDGKYDAIFAGPEHQSPMPNGEFVKGYPPTIFYNDGTGDFRQGSGVVLATSEDYVKTIDVIFHNGNLYLLRVKVTYGPGGGYAASAIQRINLTTLKSTMIFSDSKIDIRNLAFGSFIIPYQGNIVDIDAGFKTVVPQ